MNDIESAIRRASAHVTNLQQSKDFILRLVYAYRIAHENDRKFLGKCYFDAVTAANELFDNRPIKQLGPEENYEWNVLIKEINNITL